MAERHRDPAAFSARRPPITACHLRVRGGLVEEHEPVRAEIEVALEPGQTRCLHVLPFLLGGVAGVFSRTAKLTVWCVWAEGALEAGAPCPVPRFAFLIVSGR